MENYSQFLERINSFEKKETYFGDNYVRTNGSLMAKVDEQNRYAGFYGDTVVFHLDEETKRNIHEYVTKMRECAAECFCESLDFQSYHMTLHDITNSPQLWHISDELFRNEIQLAEILKGKKIEHQTIRMKTKYVFNMVHASMVMGLYPSDETEYEKLMKLYSIVDEVKPLNYLLTPHITLGYFNRFGFNAAAARKLEAVVKELNEKDTFEIVLDTRNLYYQKFTSMNHFVDIFCMERD